MIDSEPVRKVKPLTILAPLAAAVGLALSGCSFADSQPRSSSTPTTVIAHQPDNLPQSPVGSMHKLDINTDCLPDRKHISILINGSGYGNKYNPGQGGVYLSIGDRTAKIPGEIVGFSGGTDSFEFNLVTGNIGPIRGGGERIALLSDHSYEVKLEDGPQGSLTKPPAETNQIYDILVSQHC